MNYNDDEEIPTKQDSAEPKGRPFIAGKMKLRVTNKEKAPLEATNFTVMLELEGNGLKEGTPGVDIVTVLDVSGSMGDDNRLEKMKSSMQLLIKKLSPIHRLSVVTFSSRSERLCPLLGMTQEGQQYIEALVNSLEARGGTNIAGGLRLALKVLEERNQSRGRVAAIMLMSDGDQGSRYEDVRNVSVGKVPVFTFGFGRGRDYNPQVLNAVARNSKGGTFSVADVESTESNNLSIAFAQCLAGLLTVVVQDLQLTVTRAKSDIVINGVSTKLYPIIGDAESRTISFGHLYDGETRSVLVSLDLPAINNEAGYEVFEITYSYVYDSETFEAPPVTVSVARTRGQLDEESEKVATEKSRVETVDKMQEATDLADKGKFGDAQSKLEQAQNLLEGAKLNFVIEVMKSQVAQLLYLMRDPQIYSEKGRHIALAMLTSHYRQRQATIGDDPTMPSLFATPATKALAQQAIKFMEDPDVPVLPFTKDDVVIPIPEQKESPINTIPNPLVPIISHHIGTVIEALQAIQQLLDSSM